MNAVQLDPSILENLPIEQISQLLEQAGIDPTSIDPADLPTVLQDLLQSNFNPLSDDK